MAINDSVQNEQTAQQASQQPRQSQQAADTGNLWATSFHTGKMFGAPISRGVGSEFYSKLKTSLIEVYKQSNDDVEISLLDMDNVNEPALQFSCIIVAQRLKRSPETGVGYHTLILEATGDRVTPINDTYNGAPLEILRVTSDALDDVLMKMAQEKVRKAFPQGPWYMVDATVVPASFNPDDKFAVHQLALNAGLAAGVELLTKQAGFKDINLASVAHDSSMNINVQFARQQILDAVGYPMRSDVLLNFASRKNTGGGKYAPINSGDREQKVSELSGFIDLLWNPVQPQNMMNPWQTAVMPGQTQKYAARLVITNLASNYSYTPGSVLLALATGLALRDNNNWIQAFRPQQTSRDELDITDIGALNIEANLNNDPSGFGARIDTKADNFKLEDLGQLVGALIQPGLIVSLDCPEVGAQSWYLSVFSHAANGSQPAYNIIYEAAQQLTNGNFGKYFPKGTPMFVDNNNRIHLGTWIDRNGQKRDIRDIDHIAVCNLVGERNPSAIRDWSDTFLRQEYPLPLRLYARKKMISSLTNETATFTGFAQRVTFSAAFMEALAKGIKDTGLNVSVNTPLSGSDFNNQRGVASFAQSALLVPGQSFMMAAGAYGYQPQFQYAQGNTGYRF